MKDQTNEYTNRLDKALMDSFELEEASEMEEQKKKKEREGGNTQYACVGGGYTPTTKTTLKLKPGCYKVLPVQRELVFMPQPLITDSILKLSDSKSLEVVTEIEKFWTLKSKYQEHGLSFKRGFLLHGPPGSGKTCTVALIIKETIEKGGVVIYGSNMGWLSTMLQAFREIESDRPLVVVLEDIDAIAQQQEEELLSLLDGETQIDNVVFIGTTNYPEKLDGRIVNRPSRFDKIVKIDVPNETARRQYLEEKIKTTTAPNGADLVAATKGLSIAHIRELIVALFVFGHDYEETLSRLKKMKHVPKSQGGNAIGIGIDLGGSDEAAA